MAAAAACNGGAAGLLSGVAAWLLLPGGVLWRSRRDRWPHRSLCSGHVATAAGAGEPGARLQSARSAAAMQSCMPPSAAAPACTHPK